MEDLARLKHFLQGLSASRSRMWHAFVVAGVVGVIAVSMSLWNRSSDDKVASSTKIFTSTEFKVFTSTNMTGERYVSSTKINLSAAPASPPNLWGMLSLLLNFSVLCLFIQVGFRAWYRKVLGMRAGPIIRYLSLLTRPSCYFLSSVTLNLTVNNSLITEKNIQGEWI